MRDLNTKEEEMKEEVEAAAKAFGLDFFPIKFKICDFNTLNYIISTLGFPHRYPHWRFGMDYTRMQKRLGYGFGRLYELVINNDPAIAYLLEYNNEVQQKTVMAHVYPHSDFFKNNYAFAETNRNMLRVMADNDVRIRYYMDKFGEDTVEKFIDACLSLENLIDPYSVRFKRKKDDKVIGVKEDDESVEHPSKFEVKPYMDDFINTEDIIQAQLEDIKKEKEKAKKDPQEPTSDVLSYIIEKSDKLSVWQRKVLSIIREEAYYFWPQRQTKIMNEGWAVYGHSELMAGKMLATDGGLVEYSKTHSQGASKDKYSINPYHMGYHLFEYIKECWDKGKHGPEYEREKDITRRKKWDTNENKGKEKIFEVRSRYTDIEFIREFLTEEFIEEYQYYKWGVDQVDGSPVIVSRDANEIRRELLEEYTNYGEPTIQVIDGNYNNRKELFLFHKIDFYELKPYERDKTLENTFKPWQRPVHLLTKIKDKPVIFSHDGQSTKRENLDKHELYDQK